MGQTRTSAAHFIIPSLILYKGPGIVIRGDVVVKLWMVCWNKASVHTIDKSIAGTDAAYNIRLLINSIQIIILWWR
jgi:hypothetical protein